MQQGKEVERRVVWVDAARGLGILAIVIGHTYLPGQSTPALWTFLYAFHVPLFMFLSGLVFVPDKYSLARLLVTKIRTIVVPYLVWSAVSVSIFLVVGLRVAETLGRLPKSDEWLGVLRDVLWSNPSHGGLKWNTPLWFLTALFVVQLVGWLFLKAMTLLRAHRAVTMLVVIVIAWVASQTFLLYDLPWSAERAVFLLPFFCAGSLMRNELLSWQPLPRRRPVHLAAGVAAFVLMFLVATVNGTVDYVNKDFGNLSLFAVAALLGVLAVGLLSAGLQDARTLRELGESSMTILVLHKFPVVALQLLVARVSYGLGWLAPLLVIIGGAAATAMSYAAHAPLARYVPWAIGARPRPELEKRSSLDNS